jgi:hypothetical protein
VTTLHSINSGIQKLSQLTPNVASYRGTSGMNMPKQLLEHDALVSAAAALALGVEVILTPPCIIH